MKFIALGEFMGIICILILVGIGIAAYIISKKRDARPLWQPEDEAYLKASLSRLYAIDRLDVLENITAEEIKAGPRYHDLLKAASNERQAELAQNLTPSFEEKEKTTRKKWLVTFLSNYAFYWISCAFLMVFFGEASKKELAYRLGLFISLTLFIGMMMWVIYHCAYKKKGTRLLSWIVIVAPIQTVLSVAKEGFNPSTWYFTAFDLILFGFFWFNSLHLRKINLEIKTRKQLAALKSL